MIANKLIACNFDRTPEKQPLTAHRTELAPEAISLRSFPTSQDEAAWIAADISRRDLSSQSKCVVLARARALLDVAVSALNDAGLPGFLAVKKTEFASASLQWLHSVLRLANAPSSKEHLARVCKSFFYLEGINTNAADIVSAASTVDGNFLRAWVGSVLQRRELTAETRSVLQVLLSKLVERLDFWAFVKASFSWLDHLPQSRPDTDGIFTEYEDEKSTWNGLVFDIIEQFGGQSEVTLHLLLQELDLRSNEPPPPKNGIPCYTIHSSKGLEFDRVYLMGLVEDQLPSWAAIKKGDQSREMQEERRNCFVAITRAQKTLTLTYSVKVRGWNKRPSRFLYEMDLIA